MDEKCCPKAGVIQCPGLEVMVPAIMLSVTRPGGGGGGGGYRGSPHHKYVHVDLTLD